ncbi:hypothetical protein PB72LOC_04464 [Pectobacterium atrosepticum]|nr:hypothetical protein PB72LOC_04464 [Pectobacterium atrosepticum]
MTNYIRLKTILSSGLSLMIFALIGLIGYLIKDEMTLQTIFESLKMICLFVILLLPLLLLLAYKKITYRRQMYSEHISLSIVLVTFALIYFFIFF